MINFSTASHRFLIFILIGFGFVFLMMGNGLLSLTHPDEVFYVQTAQEMLQHNSWLTPYLFDHPQFEKPIFFYWLLAIASKLFGPGPFAMRFWSAFFGILGMIVVYWVSWMLFARKRLAFLAGLILATSAIYVGMSRTVFTDMVVSFWVTAALASFYWAYNFPKRKNAGIILFFVFSALAVLTKGLLGIGFPSIVAYLYLIHKKDLKFFHCRATLLGVLLFIVIAVPWHLLMYQWYGKDFIDEYWKNVHVRRLFEAEHKRCDKLYFYPGIMLGGMMPWTFFLLPALFFIGKNLMGKMKVHRSQVFFLIFWVLGTLAVPQVAKSKLASYILPVFAPLAIITAYYFDDMMQRGRGCPCWLRFQAGGYFLAAAIGGVGITAIFYARHYTEFVANFFPLYVFVILLGFCALGIAVFTRKKKITGVMASVMAIMGSLLITFSLSYRQMEPWFSCREISLALNKVDQSHSIVLASKIYTRGRKYINSSCSYVYIVTIVSKPGWFFI